MRVHPGEGTNESLTTDERLEREDSLYTHKATIARSTPSNINPRLLPRETKARVLEMCSESLIS